MKLAIYKNNKREIIEFDDRLLSLLGYLDYDQLINLNNEKKLNLITTDEVKQKIIDNNTKININKNNITKDYLICKFIKYIINLFNKKTK